MSSLIETIANTGQFPYAVIHSPTGQVWNTTLNSGAGGWENYAGGHWAQYAVPLAEQAGSGYYSATYPGGISGVLTTEVLYDNETPTLGDAPVGMGQSQGDNLAAVGGDATAPGKLAASLAGMTLGAAVTGTLAPGQFTTDVVNSDPNAYAGLAIKFATGSLAGQGATISEYDPDSQTITVTGPFTEAPANGDVFVIF